jgi:hypothetical protein
VEAEFFHSDRRTDGLTNMKLIVAFRSFANAPKKEFTTVQFFFFFFLISFTTQGGF